MRKEKVFVLIAIFTTMFSILFVAASGTDLNNDGTTNRTDISLLATVYRTSNATFDRNNDGTVNLFDMVSVARNVSNGSLPTGLVFASEWNTALGTSSAAYMDTGRTRPWTSTEGFANNDTCNAFRVFNTASEGRDFPTTNFLRLKSWDFCSATGGGITDGWSQIGFLAGSNYIPPLEVGDSVFIRYYHRVLFPQSYTGGGGQRRHGDEWVGSLGSIPYSPTHSISTSTEKWQWELRSTLPNGDVYCDGNGYEDFIHDKNVTYRIEHGITRTNSTSYSIRARIYSQSGTLLYDSGDFNRKCGDSAPGSLLTISFTGDDNVWNIYARQFQIGLNGIVGLNTSNDEQDVFEWAGFAVSAGPDGTWLGPYTSAEASFTTP